MDIIYIICYAKYQFGSERDQHVKVFSRTDNDREPGQHSSSLYNRIHTRHTSKAYDLELGFRGHFCSIK